MVKQANYELIFALVNQGFTDGIMEAATAEGARGGTIITTRGGANEEAEKNYGVAITPDKELILILVKKDIKENVLKAIYKVAGIETKAMGIIWSIPADNVVGLSKTMVSGKNNKNKKSK